MTPEHPIRRGQRYNRIILAIFVVGIVAFFVGMALDQYFAGLVVYAIAGVCGIATSLYVRFVSSARLGDERDRHIHERTSTTVVTLLTYVGLPVVITLYLLEATGYFTITPTMSGAIWAYAGLYLVWGVVFAIYRYRR